MIACGDVDCALAGASDASITPLCLAGYHRMGAYAPEEMCPYDRRRKGFIIGEGSGVVLLEKKDCAEKRGAYIYGELRGYQMAQETAHILSFDFSENTLRDSLVMLMRALEWKTVDYINTHGTATDLGDLYETEQLKKAFGRDAYGLSMSSTKAALGHLLGAAGAVEFIICLLSMKHGFIPPTVQYKEKDARCDLNYTPNQSVKKNVTSALSLSMGFGGHIGIIAVAKG
jgi:3-oxoacyl-[acyl-carrier-protein] synthase II